MNEELFKIFELAQQGFLCSQILLMMGLEAGGKSNPDLVRAMTGLAGGLGFCGKNCGALTGGACLISLYAGKGSPEEADDSRHNEMIAGLVEWFESEYGKKFGSINCRDILEDNPKNMNERCPDIVLKTFEKVKEILEKYEYNLSGKSEE